MNVDYLTNYADHFLMENYSLNLDVPVVINNRLRNCMGAFVYSAKQGAIKIEISGYMLKYATESIVLDTLEHELIHYALFRLEKPCRDGESYFENELKKKNVGSTKDVMIGKFMGYSCPKCNEEYMTETMKVMNNPSQYRTRCCKEAIKPTKFIIFNGKEELEMPYVCN